jgi:hypothetical protein
MVDAYILISQMTDIAWCVFARRLQSDGCWRSSLFADTKNGRLDGARFHFIHRPNHGRTHIAAFYRMKSFTFYFTY